MTPPGLPRAEPDRRCRQILPPRKHWILSTTLQRSRYVSVGIVVPLLCLYLDPFLFQGELMPLGGNHIAFSYVLIGASMAAFSVRLALRRGSAFLAGMIVAGAAFASLLAVILLPVMVTVIVRLPPVGPLEISLLAIVMLCTTPVFVAHIYFQVAKAAWLEAKDRPQRRAGLAALAGSMSVLALAIFAQLSIRAEFNRVISAASEGGTISAAELKAVRLLDWGKQTDLFVERYMAESDPEKRERLATAYRLIAGQDIRMRIRQRSD